jgi:hypothetical protein
LQKLALTLLLVVATPVVWAEEDFACPKTLKLAHPSIVVAGTTFVPLREMADWMGAKLEVDGGKLIVSEGEMKVSLEIGSLTAQLNEQEIKLTFSPFKVTEYQLKKVTNPKTGKPAWVVTIGAYVMAPLSVLAQGFGYQLSWQAEKGQVTITNNSTTAILETCPFIELNLARNRGSYANYNFPILGGRPDYPTPLGWYVVWDKDIDHVSTQWPKPHGGAKMPHAMFFAAGAAIHDGSLRVRSHKCVHVRRADGSKLFGAVSLGTLVWSHK